MKILLPTIVAWVAIALMPFTSRAQGFFTGPPRQSLTPAESQQLDARLANFRDQFALEGGSAALVMGDKLLWSGGNGTAEPDGPTPAAADTVYSLASVSKLVTATAIMQLAEAGRLDLDADVTKYLPFTLRNPQFRKQKITARQLLTHTSSLQDDHYATIYEDNFRFFERDSPISLADFCQGMLAPDGAFYSQDSFAGTAPGREHIYSNLGYALLGYIAERVSMTPFDQLTKQRIFTPLGMTSTTWKLAEVLPASLAMPLDAEGNAYGHYTYADYPNGGLFSTANDMSRFLRAILLEGQLNGVRVLKAKSVQAMLDFRYPRPEAGYAQGQGLGWLKIALDSTQPSTVGHAGGEAGVNTIMLFNPSTKVGALAFFHKDFPATDDALAMGPLMSDYLQVGQGLVPLSPRNLYFTQSKVLAMDQYLGSLQRRAGFSGSVLVAQGGRVILQRGYGLADRENETVITPETRFAIGSITKSITAAGILLLQDRGLLNLEDPISQYLPDAPAAWAPVKIKHLLNHTSGIPDYLELILTVDPEADPSLERTREEILSIFADEPLNFVPGSQWSYSNSGFYLLGDIIASASGTPYEMFIQENILNPLGMRATGFDYEGAVTEGTRAVGYSRDEEGNAIVAPRFHPTVTYAAGAMYSTVGDLLIWARAQRPYQLLSAEALALMTTPNVKLPFLPTDERGKKLPGYTSSTDGYGWFQFKRFKRKFLSHDGAINGFQSQLDIYPEDQLVVISLQNTELIVPAVLNDNVADRALK